MAKDKPLTKAQEDFVKTLVERLPPLIARKKVHRFLGGLVAPQTLSNADASGEGPEGAYRLGKSVVYRTEDLARLLVKRYGVAKIAHIKTL